MRADIAELDWPPDLFDSAEPDEPLAGQDHCATGEKRNWRVSANNWGSALVMVARSLWRVVSRSAV